MQRYYGLDIHRDYCYGYELPAGGGDGRRFRFPNTDEAWRAFAAQLNAQDAVALEVSGSTFRLYDLLAERAGQVVVVDARVMRRLGSRKRKTDAGDAQLLAQRLALGTLPAVWVPPAELRELRRLVTLRARLVRARTQWRNYVRSLLHRHGYRGSRRLWRSKAAVAELWGLSLPVADRIVLATALDAIGRLTQHVRAIDAEIARRVKKQPAVRLLLSLPGFGHPMAAAFYAYVGDPGRFANGKLVVSYVGLAPCVHPSGTVERRGGITKEGPRVLRWLLIEAASSVANTGPEVLRAFYRRIKAKRGHQVAIVALAAKLVRIAWTVWRQGIVYAGARPALYAAKLRALDRMGRPYPVDRILQALAKQPERLVDRRAYPSPGPYAAKTEAA